MKLKKIKKAVAKLALGAFLGGVISGNFNTANAMFTLEQFDKTEDTFKRYLSRVHKLSKRDIFLICCHIKKIAEVSDYLVKIYGSVENAETVVSMFRASKDIHFKADESSKLFIEYLYIALKHNGSAGSYIKYVLENKISDNFIILNSEAIEQFKSFLSIKTCHIKLK